MTGPVWATEHGDPDIADRGEILRTVVGSGLHGMALAGQDDHDEMGVYIEPAANVIGMLWDRPSLTQRTRPDGHRSGPGDTDLVRYSLRHYLRLAAAGNPTVLLPLFAPDRFVLCRDWYGDALRRIGPLLLTVQTGRKFHGYMQGQRHRLEQQAGRGIPNRPELIAAHGYDTKYAAHALRLGYEGVEVMLSRTLTLPIAAGPLEQIMQVRTGQVDKAEALRRIDAQQVLLESLIGANPAGLPAGPDYDELSAWSVRVHQAFWRDGSHTGL